MSQNTYRFSILGRKVGMTQVFDADRNVVPVTVLEVGPCTVIQKKTKESDGYDAVQLGFDDKKKQRVLKPEAGHFEKAKTAVKRFIKEVRLDEKTIGQYEIGQTLSADILKAGDKVDVVGVSIGKGFQGVIKRHGFATVDYTHNAEFFRHGGSIGCREWPGKVWKGKKMSGHMGAERVTVQSLEVVRVDAERNLLLIKGAVPGATGGDVVVRPAVKARG